MLTTSALAGSHLYVPESVKSALRINKYDIAALSCCSK